MKVEDRDIIRERVDVNCQIIKRGIIALAEAWIHRMDERRGTAHPAADKGCVLGNVASMVLMPQDIPLHTDHHVTRYKGKNQSEQEGCLFDLSLF